VPAAHSGQAGRENLTIQHPCHHRVHARRLTSARANRHHARVVDRLAQQYPALHAKVVALPASEQNRLAIAIAEHVLDAVNETGRPADRASAQASVCESLASADNAANIEALIDRP
jgi:hypothetical protein